MVFDYDSIPVEVHGGLTFSSRAEDCKTWAEIPIECRKDFWIIGFDRMHAGDNMITCPYEYVVNEAMALAVQLES